MSISLPLSKDGYPNVEQSAHGVACEALNVETCLRHFTAPEMLTDPVMCPNCDKKTSTKKQHVVSKLPKVLCLHLKRFNAATNKKIEDFVSFPCRGLNMGPFLPQWCEVSRVPLAPSIDSLEQWVVPEIQYDLYATVNHFGNLQSGHYVSNVLVKNQWYHCNDSFIGFATEAEILRSEGAYILFYIRR
jgi:ubiquitin carboxyl-terminal hydrolase 22/27/51